MATVQQWMPRLTAQMTAVCPCLPQVGDPADKLTWLVVPLAGATLPQIAAAQAVIDGFDTSDAAQAAWEDDQKPERKSLRQAAAGAIADIDTYLAIASPNNAQVVAQVRRLSLDTKAVIKRLIQVD